MKRLFTLCAVLLSMTTFAFANSSREQTLALIKPNAVNAHHVGDILHFYEDQGLSIVGLKMVSLTKKDAEAFYSAHRERPFFNDLTNFMSSGPIIAIALEGPSAVAKNRELMGATDPSKANDNTIRRRFGKNITENAVHGSDSKESAQDEISFFFSELELQH